MPDATRPTRSMFFKVLKSVVSGDKSLNRITSNPGGKNVSIIFAYATSKAFEKSMKTTGKKGKTGVQVFENHEWVSPKDWLTEMGWGINNGSVSNEAVFMVKELFNSFVQDEVLESKGEFPELQYKYIKDLDYPSDEQVAAARNSNKYFMMALEDLIDLLPASLEKGEPVASRRKSTYLPLWEAFLSDPLTDIFREEMIIMANEHLPKTNDGKLNVLEIATGTGSGTVRLMRDLIQYYENTHITIYCFDEIANQINRAKERINAYDKKMKPTYSSKGLTFEFQFHVKRYRDPITLEADSVDLIVSFQNQHYMSKGDRYAFMENLSRMLNEDGQIIIAQTTSYNDLFPHPLTFAYLPVEGFHGYPTVDEMKELVSSFFKKHTSSGIDAIWVISKPRFGK